jgi:uncharacterized protein (DUF2249 family)
MKILFDQGTPLPLKYHLIDHEIQTAFELGWSNLKNGELLEAAEKSFDLLITTDQRLKYQQNLSARKLSIVVLMTTSWPRIQLHVPEILQAIDKMERGEYLEITLT